MPAVTYGVVLGAVFWTTSPTVYNITNGIVAFPSGITFGARTHPLAGSVNLQYLSLDGNSATHRIKVGNPYPDGTTFNAAITATHPGWCLRFPFAPGVSGTYTKPTSTAVLIDGITDSGNPNVKLSLTTTGRFVLTVVDTSSANPIDFTAANPIPDTVDDYQCEIWYCSHSGALEVGEHMVVRLVKISDRSVVNYINVNLPVGYPATTNLSVDNCQIYVGENSARGAGFAPQLGPFYFANEDAADPYGLIRVDRMEPNGIGHTDEWPGASADVDESGTSIPSEADIDSITYNNGGSGTVTKTQLYDLTAPLDVTGSDALTGALVVSAWASTPLTGASKSSSNFMTGLISDGTNDREAGSSIATHSPIDVYQSWQWVFGKDPTAGVLGHGDLANLEAGVRAHSSSTSNVLFRNAAMTVTVPYVKAGETVEALIAPPSLAWPRPYKRRQFVPIR